MIRMAQALASVAVLGAGSAGAWYLVATRPSPEPRVPTTSDPIVRVLTIRPAEHRLVVRGYGNVRPAVETLVVAQVGGRIDWLSPNLVDGGHVAAGEELARLERTDHEAALAGAEAQVALAGRRVVTEEAEAAAAKAEWELARPGKEPGDLVLRKPQLAEARAALAAATSSRDRARLDLDRTVIRAPYAGRVRTRRAGPRQVLAPGSPLAEIYGTEHAEIEVPVALDELAHLEGPLGVGAAAVVRADVAGRRVEWRGEVARTGAAVDAKSRMIPLVVVVKDPYAAGDRPPLVAGLFVEVELVGRTLAGAIRIPRAALRGSGEVIVVDREDRLHLGKVDVLRIEDGHAILRAGLAAGDRVCLSSVPVFAEGLKVRPVEDSSR